MPIYKSERYVKLRLVKTASNNSTSNHRSSQDIFRDRPDKMILKVEEHKELKQEEEHAVRINTGL